MIHTNSKLSHQDLVIIRSTSSTDKFVPMKQNYNNQYKWINRSVTKCRRSKFKAWKEYKTDKTEANINRYQTKLKESRNKNRLAKRNYEKKLCNNIKNNSKSFYAYV